MDGDILRAILCRRWTYNPHLVSSEMRVVGIIMEYSKCDDNPFMNNFDLSYK